MRDRLARIACLLLFVFGTTTSASGAQDLDQMKDQAPCAIPLGAAHVDPGLQRIVHEMWQRSPIFRRQIARIGRERPLVVSLGYCATSCPSSARGHTILEIQAGVLRRADVRVRVFTEATTAEMIAHELEHVLERLDGVDFPRLTKQVRRVDDAGPGREHAYETERARHVGLAAAREYRTRAGRPLQCQEAHP